MDVFMSNISFYTGLHELIRQLSAIFHESTYTDRFTRTGLPLNFHVRLLKNNDRRTRGFGLHGGKGFITLPTIEVAEYFLNEYGDRPGGTPPKSFVLGTRNVKFTRANKPAPKDIIERTQRQPYEDPSVAEERERRDEVLKSHTISIKTIQFGWDCRDEVYSVEWEHHAPSTLNFDHDRREFRISIPHQPPAVLIIAIRPSQITEMSAHVYRSQPVLFFSLSSHPSFLFTVPNSDRKNQRLPCLPFAEHERLVAYTSLALRLECASTQDLHQFRNLCRAAQLRAVHDWEYPIVKNHLFSETSITLLNSWLRKLNWCVAFQVEALIRRTCIDVQEALELMPAIMRLVKLRGKKHVAQFLQHIATQLTQGYYDTSQGTISDFFIAAELEYVTYKRPDPVIPSEGSLFQSLHIVVTPTTMYLEGPFPERSNRVIRSYPNDHESFLRVSFVDEDRLQFRFDRDVDGPAFIRLRVGKFLHDGLKVAGRTFEFLAYSQSALKEHAVWFVKPFRDASTRQVVNAASIIKGLGDFSRNLDLVYCPARYGARISQAFTATDATLVEVEEILHIPDISTVDKKYDFTDGVGTMSKELARAIWSELKPGKRRNRIKPPAFQIRFMGSKGMLSIDYKLEGLTICLRPSMIKFEGAESRKIEIARAFDRPGKYYLNRPLIMLLEGLGVPYDVFEEYQDRAVQQIRQSTHSLESAARMLEHFGLGNAYRLTSVMLSLSRLGIMQSEDNFYQTMIKYAVHHVLRDLKNHARIPIEGAWTLVGVADVHKYLNEGEIFACIKPVDGPIMYLEGDVLISRSPTIHPGDVQIARAIGRPPPDTCFAFEPLKNTVVFSVKGTRPLCSVLGGGDLDGDLYNLIPLNKFPRFRIKIRDGASYTAAPKKKLDRQCTMEDVADFFMDYINNDVLGIIASTWVTIADQAQEGIFHPHCNTLAQLHSDAVDYPKSGQPVALDRIPRPLLKMKPDYQAPETVNPDTTNRFYPSLRAVGRLFRRIDLPLLHTEVHVTRRARRQIREKGHLRQTRGVNALAESLAALEIKDDPIAEAVNFRVFQYIDDDDMDLVDQEQEELFVARLFSQYCSELQAILAVNTLGHARTTLLTEEEAMVGTIAQKSSQPRKRNDQMAKLREQTDILVRGYRSELAGEDDLTVRLLRAWLAWKLGLRERSKQDMVGAQSFCWIALGAIFEVIREIEDQEDPYWY